MKFDPVQGVVAVIGVGFVLLLSVLFAIAMQKIENRYSDRVMLTVAGVVFAVFVFLVGSIIQ